MKAKYFQKDRGMKIGTPTEGTLTESIGNRVSRGFRPPSPQSAVIQLCFHLPRAALLQLKVDKGNV